VVEVLQGGESVVDDLVGLLSLEVRDEPDTARVMLIVGGVKSLGRR